MADPNIGAAYAAYYNTQYPGVNVNPETPRNQMTSLLGTIKSGGIPTVANTSQPTQQPSGTQQTGLLSTPGGMSPGGFDWGAPADSPLQSTMPPGSTPQPEQISTPGGMEPGGFNTAAPADSPFQSTMPPSGTQQTSGLLSGGSSGNSFPGETPTPEATPATSQPTPQPIAQPTAQQSTLDFSPPPPAPSGSNLTGPDVQAPQSAIYTTRRSDGIWEYVAQGRGEMNGKWINQTTGQVAGNDFDPYAMGGASNISVSFPGAATDSGQRVSELNVVLSLDSDSGRWFSTGQGRFLEPGELPIIDPLRGGPLLDRTGRVGTVQNQTGLAGRINALSDEDRAAFDAITRGESRDLYADNQRLQNALNWPTQQYPGYAPGPAVGPPPGTPSAPPRPRPAPGANGQPIDTRGGGGGLFGELLDGFSDRFTSPGSGPPFGSGFDPSQNMGLDIMDPPMYEESFYQRGAPGEYPLGFQPSRQVQQFGIDPETGERIMFDPSQSNARQMEVFNPNFRYSDTRTDVPNERGAFRTKVQEEDLVATQLNRLLEENSPYLQLAQTRALQLSNARGTLNSSMAVGDAWNAAIAAALPIAQQDASAYEKTRLINQEAVNAFNQQANDFMFNQSLSEQGFKQNLSLAEQQYGHNIGMMDRELMNNLTLGEQSLFNSTELAKQDLFNRIDLGRQDVQNRLTLGQQDVDNKIELGRQELFNSIEVGKQNVFNQLNVLTSQFGFDKALQDFDGQIRESLIRIEKDWNLAIQNNASAGTIYSNFLNSLGEAMKIPDATQEERQSIVDSLIDSLDNTLGTFDLLRGVEADGTLGSLARTGETFDDMVAGVTGNPRGRLTVGVGNQIRIDGTNLTEDQSIEFVTAGNDLDFIIRTSMPRGGIQQVSNPGEQRTKTRTLENMTILRDLGANNADLSKIWNSMFPNEA